MLTMAHGNTAFDPLHRVTSLVRGTLPLASVTPGVAVNYASTQWLGGKITIGSANVTVTALGRLFLSGNSHEHTLKLFDAATGLEISGGTAAFSGGTAGEFTYGALPNPITLLANHSYYLLSDELTGGDQFYDYTSTVSFASNSGIASVTHAAYDGANFYTGPMPQYSGHMYGPLDLKIAPSPAISGSFNAQNELTSRTDAAGTAAFTYDNNGNTLTDQTGHHYVYDGWNHLVKVLDTDNSTVLAGYGYDAMGRRIRQGGNDLYYSPQWQVLEERDHATGDTADQYVWSPTYVDDLVLRDDSSTGGNLGIYGSGLGRRIYVQQDANHNVTSLTDATGAVLERFVYDPYGAVTVMNGDWTEPSSPVTPGTDTYQWIYLDQGGRLDPASGLVNFRNRDLNTGTDRWMEQDPAGYVDGGSLYQYVRSDPVSWTDNSGLEAAQVIDMVNQGVVMGEPGATRLFELTVKWVNNFHDSGAIVQHIKWTLLNRESDDASRATKLDELFNDQYLEYWFNYPERNFNGIGGYNNDGLWGTGDQDTWGGTGSGHAGTDILENTSGTPEIDGYVGFALQSSALYRSLFSKKFHHDFAASHDVSSISVPPTWSDAGLLHRKVIFQWDEQGDASCWWKSIEGSNTTTLRKLKIILLTGRWNLQA